MELFDDLINFYLKSYFQVKNYCLINYLDREIWINEWGQGKKNSS